jgi:hypothetical protein
MMHHRQATDIKEYGEFGGAGHTNGTAEKYTHFFFFLLFKETIWDIWT